MSHNRKKLRGYQSSAVDSVFDYFKNKQGYAPLIVAPVGAGKSLIHAEIIKSIHAQAPRTRILSITHVKELLSQNADELRNHYPECDFGFFCAGLGQKRLSNDVTFASIQSIHNKANKFNRAPQVILVDEAHLIPHNEATTYRRFIDSCLKLNPNLVVVGLTGSPFRHDSGRLDEGENKLFSGVAYEIEIQWMIEQGYLVRPVTPKVQTKMDVSGVGSRGGDYIAGQLEAAVDIDEVTKACVSEIISQSQTRKKVLIFTAGVKHAEHVRDAIRLNGFKAEMVLGETPPHERAEIINRFKVGELKYLVNVATLTTGFNAPDIDVLAFMRPTKSPVLYLQTTGRGIRPVYAAGYDLGTQQGRLDAIANGGKPDCLILDFGGVVERLGPIDALDIRKPPKKKKEDAEPGEAITKRCPSCGIVCAGAQRYCYGCGYSFISEGLNAQASKAAVVSSDTEPEEHAVLKMQLTEHMKTGAEWEAPRTMKVTYITLAGTFYDFVCFEHHRYEVGDNKRYAWERAVKWHAKMLPDSGLRPPITVQEALTMGYKTPTRVKVKKDGKYWRVLDAYFDSNNLEPAMDVFTDLQKQLNDRKFAFKGEGIDLDNEIPF